MEERKFTDQELVRRQKLQELKDLGIDPFGQRFDPPALPQKPRFFAAAAASSETPPAWDGASFRRSLPC